MILTNINIYYIVTTNINETGKRYRYFMYSQTGT